jgi:FkbM family methyltransferase
MVLIKYGIYTNNIDVTDICLTNLTNSNIITIPAVDDNRTAYFTDPIYGTKKKIFVIINGNVDVYDETYVVKINLLTNTVSAISMNYNIYINNKLFNLHSKLKINYGTLKDEVPEQKMVVQYLTGNEKVLEIGGNIGRNSLVIASILKDSSNLVTLESDELIAIQLLQNKLLNNLNFHIEASALSKRKLMQKDWTTIPSDTLEHGYKWVNTVTFDDLKNKYNIDFDTLVLDCEGAFYYILMDMPEILDNINLIIMENNYHEIYQKEYIDNILKNNSFYIEYVEEGGWGPCRDRFFEVWKR